MQIECYYVVIVTNNGIWLDLMHHEKNITTHFYETWSELLEGYSWVQAARDEGLVHVRAAF